MRQLFNNIDCFACWLAMTERDGGAVAGRTRKDIEKQSHKSVISRENYLKKPQQDRIDGKSLDGSQSIKNR